MSKFLREGMLVFDEGSHPYIYRGEGKMPIQVGNKYQTVNCYVLQDHKSEEYRMVLTGDFEKDFYVFEPSALLNTKEISNKELMDLTMEQMEELCNIDMEKFELNNPHFYGKVINIVDVFVENHMQQHYGKEKARLYHPHMKSNFKHLMICFFIIWELQVQSKKK